MCREAYWHCPTIPIRPEEVSNFRHLSVWTHSLALTIITHIKMNDDNTFELNTKCALEVTKLKWNYWVMRRMPEEFIYFCILWVDALPRAVDHYTLWNDEEYIWMERRMLTRNTELKKSAISAVPPRGRTSLECTYRNKREYYIWKKHWILDRNQEASATSRNN